MKSLLILLLVCSLAFAAHAQISGVRVTPAGGSFDDTLTITVYPEQTTPYLVPTQREGDSLYGSWNYENQSLIFSNRVRLHAGLMWVDSSTINDPVFYRGYQYWQYVMSAVGNIYDDPNNQPYPIQSNDFTLQPDGTWQLRFVPRTLFTEVDLAVSNFAPDFVKFINFVFAGGADDVTPWTNSGRSNIHTAPWADPYTGSQGGKDFYLPLPVPAAWATGGTPGTLLRQAGNGVGTLPKRAVEEAPITLIVDPRTTLPNTGAQSLAQAQTLRLHAGLALPGSTVWHHTVAARGSNADITGFTRQQDGTWRKSIKIREYFGLSATDPIGELQFRLAGGPDANIWAMTATPPQGQANFVIPVSSNSVTSVKTLSVKGIIYTRTTEGFTLTSANSKTNYTYNIYDQLGRIVQTAKADAQGSYTGQLQQSGIYIIEAQSQGKPERIRVVY